MTKAIQLMKKLSIIFFLLIGANSFAYSQTEFELEANQSMLMTGKGPGQDGAINPFFGQDCYAIIENLEIRPFTIRIQQKGKLIEIIPIEKGEVKKVKLFKGNELYLDSNEEGEVKARVNFEEMRE